jgi:hypothetical protein
VEDMGREQQGWKRCDICLYADSHHINADQVSRVMVQPIRHISRVDHKHHFYLYHDINMNYTIF